MVKYVGYDVVFQEIPHEVTLAVSISNCPNRCAGCHSQHLTEDIGEELSPAVLSELIQRYGSGVTCVCFMGGDRNPAEIEGLARFIKSAANLKTAWYSGCDRLPVSSEHFDYVKIGAYVEKLGGLKSPTTNQRLYKIAGDGTYEDITCLFWKN